MAKPHVWVGKDSCIINMVNSSSPGRGWEDGSILVSQERKQNLREIKWLAQGHTVSKSHSWDIHQVFQIFWLCISRSQIWREQIIPECGGRNLKNGSAYYCKWQPTLKRYCLYHFFSCKENTWILHPFLCSVMSGRKCGSCQTTCSSVVSFLGPESEEDGYGLRGNCLPAMLRVVLWEDALDEVQDSSRFRNHSILIASSLWAEHTLQIQGKVSQFLWCLLFILLEGGM